MDIVDKLIFIVECYLRETGIDSYDDIALSMRASDIILGERDFKFNYKYGKKCDIVKCDKLVREFLKELNPNYLDYYNTRLLDGSFEFDFDNPYATAYSCFNYTDNKRVIYIPVTDTLEDAFSIVHELFHDINMNIDIDDEKMGRYFFTEALSYLGELLFSDFLKKNGAWDCNVDLRNLFFLRRKALEVNFNLRLINEYVSNGYLDRSMVISIIESYGKEYIDDIIEVMLYICDSDELSLKVEETYVLSNLIAVYMYNRINSNKKYINELFDLNEILADLDLGQVLDYLDLSHDYCELTNDSYSILQKEYRKFIKR